MVEDSDRTKKLMAETSNPPTEDEVVSIVASRIADQVDHDILMEIEKKLFATKLQCSFAQMKGGARCTLAVNHDGTSHQCPCGMPFNLCKQHAPEGIR